MVKQSIEQGAACSCESSCVVASAQTPPVVMAVESHGRRSVEPLAIGAAATGGLAAAACAACCVVPLAWPALAAAFSAGLFGMVEKSQAYLAFGGLALLVLAWAHLARSRGWRLRRIGGRNLALMLVATLLTLTAVSWRWLEPMLLDLLP